MASPLTVIGTVLTIEPASGDRSFDRTDAGDLKIVFSSGEHGVLARSHPRFQPIADFLASLVGDEVPVHAELDGSGRFIRRLRLPLDVTVADIRRLPNGDLDVVLMLSHARHTLRAGNPRFAELAALLDAARRDGGGLLVVENDQQEIPDAIRDPKFIVSRRADPIWIPPESPPFAADVLSGAQLANAFAAVLTMRCEPSAAPAPCIPFQFVGDGCHVRADLMCHALAGTGVSAGKCWTYGDFHIPSASYPTCHVVWDWHVATAVRLNTAQGPETYVIDPSLFDQPVPLARWLGRMAHPAPAAVITGPSRYYRLETGYEYPVDMKHRDRLAEYYRKQLRNQTAESGVPPFANCH